MITVMRKTGLLEINEITFSHKRVNRTALDLLGTLSTLLVMPATQICYLLAIEKYILNVLTY